MRMKTRRGLIGTLALAGAAALLLSACSTSGAADKGDGSGDEPATPAGNFGDCEITENPEVHELDLIEPGNVTTKVPLPTPGAIIGDTPDTVSGGYLYCIAAEIANRGGASDITLQNTTFEAIISGVDSDFDYTVWDVIITPEREEVIDFATPYRTFDATVVTLEGSDVTPENFKDKRIGTLNGARQAPWIEENVKPSQQLRAYNENQEMITALITGQIDAFVHDTDGALLFVGENIDQGLVPVGRLPIEFSVGPVLKKGDPNTPAVSKIVEDMLADGTMDAIYEKWVYPKWGGYTVDDIPEWNVATN